MSSRARRTTAKAVNYAKEQEFSDEDIFEDEPVEQPTTKPKRKPKKKKDVDDEDMINHQHPVFTEKGYDASLPPIRERFPFLPEYEEDGTPKIELIVGRRPIDEKENAQTADSDNDENDEDGNNKQTESDQEDEEDGGGGTGRTRRRRGANNKTPNTDSPKKTKRGKGKGKQSESPNKNNSNNNEQEEVVEYEYLVKYRGRSYLHLEWKTGADLESMNKSAKGIYRRYLKKIAAGHDDDIENPEFDPLYVVPQKIIDEAEQEIMLDLTDKELLKWEKQRQKELKEAMEQAEAESDDDNEKKENGKEKDSKDGTTKSSDQSSENQDEKKDDDSTKTEDDWPDELDFKNFDIDLLRRILEKEGPYYPTVEGCDNPYRDGYITEPPKKPRASYLFFQCALRSYFVKKQPNAVQAELMGMLGEAWRAMDEIEKEPFQILANEEAKQYEKQKALLEKAQKPNAVWQPLRRCRQVLDRLSSDSFADIFLEPVDLNDFPDYQDVVDIMMDLGTVRQRLENKKYMAPEQFARDMRRIWNNCKIYNQHGSAIWHVADYMSKQFERLYHAWVLEFRERYLRWANPRARPWEHSCRIHDGKCGTPDDKMVLCDHCDAMYGLQCLQPPIKKVPAKGWHCPDCAPKLKSAKGARMLSAVAEHAARKRAELGDPPKKKITRTMYLVKWAGLGYEFCTWETKEDIGNDALVAVFHKLEKGFSEEADMPEEMIENFLHNTKHVNADNAGGNGSVPALKAQLYAQSRAIQFVKFGLDLPKQIGSELGPKTNALCECIHHSGSTVKTIPREIVECVQDLVFRTARKQGPRNMRSHTCLLPPLAAEYDVIVPITSKGLMMNVGEIHGSVAFLGYRQFPDGSKGPAEMANIIRNVGDKIIAVDGVSTVGMSFKEVINLLRESGKNKFAYMRFLESRFSVCDGSLTSVGPKGQYTCEEMLRKLRTDRQNLVVQRLSGTLEEEEEQQKANDDDESAKDDSDGGSEAGSEGSFEPDSDEDELMDTKAVDEVSPSATKDDSPEKNENEQMKLNDHTSDSGEPTKDLLNSSLPVEKSTINENTDTQTNEEKQKPSIISREETTRSLAVRLLDVDLGYSSDEAGDEECVYYLDGVDETFATKHEFDSTILNTTKPLTGNKEVLVPASKSEFAALGEKGKLAVAVALAKNAPVLEDFENFPNVPKTEDEKPEEDVPSPPKSTKRSNVKIEQVSASTGDIIHIWANVEAAAATLQLPLPELRQVLRGEYDEEIGEEVGGFKWRYALVGAKVTAGIDSTSRGGGGKKAKQAWLEFRDKLYDPNEPHIYKNGNRLRDYQVDGVNWLASTWYKRQGCILADEMGLGKTVQIVCYIEHIFRVEKIHRPFLVVVPLSTIEHWRREFEGWTDMVCCVYHDRQRVWRDVMREYEWYYEDRPHTPEFLKFDVLVTTYDTLIGDFDVISQIPFRVAVVDEAHRLRNQRGKLLECMREISAKGTMQYGFQSRVLMSGTPLQNDLAELWTLLNFVDPFKFSDLEVFQENFGNMANKSQVESLQQMISPFMLRRVKEDVAKDIPAKEETVIDVELTSIQKQYYRAIFEHNHAFLNMGATRTTTPKLMNIQMELRKVCNHPFLLDGVEHRETDRQFKEFLEKGALDGKSPEEQQQMLNEHGYIMTSGKMVLLDKLLPKLRQEGHKILIFSQMVKMIDLISEYCEFRDYPYERLDGRVRGTERQKAIDRFEREENSFLFLLSTRAGGVGINLTAADICIIFDSDWNPQNDVQAQARCHRIGQTKDVRIYRLITSRSFEQEMFDRASRKLGLEQAVLGTFEKEQEDDKPSQQEMEQLLKKGAYALLEDDNDEVTKEFCADDIENILAKRTRTRVVEGAKTASWLNKQGMVVSKSKFTAEVGNNLDMDDPLFWQKVMPDYVTPSMLLQKLKDIEDDYEGKKKGPGRGRGRWRKKREEEAKKAAEEEAQRKLENGGELENGNVPEDAEKNNDLHSNEKRKNGETIDSTPNKGDGSENEDADKSILSPRRLENEEDNEDHDSGSDDDDDEHDKKKSKKLSRSQIHKIQKFMSDLKSMMQNIIEDEEEEGLTPDEKNACQKLLLTVSVKERIFNEEQRFAAKKFLKHFEGDRRRRCRTSDQTRFQPGKEEENLAPIREELLITGKKRKKRRKRGEPIEDITPRKKRKRSPDNTGGYIGEDGYLHHTDSEDDWSDVGEDLYKAGTKKDKISRKEAKRRRQWTADDDAATAAGRPWPVFPRHLVKKVLSTVLDKVIKYDEDRGGVFSVPVPKDEFPEYYEQIKKPMDYGTMRSKLANGEYRSAQAMQKDFVLIMQNCRQFNDDRSDIVRSAREQHLMRPKFLKEAADEHNLYLGEDGSVLEIIDDKTTPKKKGKSKKNSVGDDDVVPSKKSVGNKKDKKSKDEEQMDVQDATSKPKKKKKKKGSTEEENKETDAVGSKKKPRIRIKMKSDTESVGEKEDVSEDEVEKIEPVKKHKKKSKRKREVEPDPEDDSDASEIVVTSKKRKKNDGKAAKPKRTTRAANKSIDHPDDDKPLSEFVTRSSKTRKSSSSKKSSDELTDIVWQDSDYWKNGREMLNGTFKAARKHFTHRGPWELPSGIPKAKFTDVALHTLEKMNKLDRYSVFAEEVTDDEAPGYSEIVKYPMDFGTMRQKVKNGEYGTGSAAAKAFYNDFKLVFDNCYLYNDEGNEVTDEASRILGFLPETYVAACARLLKQK